MKGGGLEGVSSATYVKVAINLKQLAILDEISQ